MAFACKRCGYVRDLEVLPCENCIRIENAKWGYKISYDELADEVKYEVSPTPPTELEKLRDLVREWYEKDIRLTKDIPSGEVQFIQRTMQTKRFLERLYDYCSKQGWTEEGENGG